MAVGKRHWEKLQKTVMTWLLLGGQKKCGFSDSSGACEPESSFNSVKNISTLASITTWIKIEIDDNGILELAFD